jgi:ribosomal protein L29
MATKKSPKTKLSVVADLKTPDELRAALITAQSELIDTKRSHAARELANTARLKELRVQIARIQTRLSSPDTIKEKA